MPTPTGPRWRKVIVSPHPDDAIWSSGGRIARWVSDGANVLVVTVFDGEPVTLPRDWRRIAAPALRRAEDQRALREIGAHSLSWSFIDAALRRDEDGFVYHSPDELTRRVAPADEPLLAALTGCFSRLPAGVELHVPLGAGGHVDHVLVREAARRSGRQPLVWYEEFPYPRPDRQAGLVPAWEPVELQTWLAAGLCYRSQVLTLFGSADRFMAAIRQRAHDMGRDVGMAVAERTWSATALRYR